MTERKLKLFADKHNRGFTLLELLIVLSVITLVSLISMTRWEFKAHANKNIDILSSQIRAMRNQQEVKVSDSMHFNANGNINRAQTIKYDHKTCVFQLGFGRFYCE